MFTAWVGVMLQTQPFFISGIEDYDTAKSSAFGASGMFLFCICASIFSMMRGSDEKEEASAENGVESEYQLASDVPTYGTNN